MRFAFIVNNYPPRMGGLESHVHSLVRHLSRLGHDVLVVTLADTPGESVEDGVKVVRLAEHSRVGEVLGFPRWGATRRIARLMVEHRIDVISVHTRFFPLSWIGMRVGLLRDVPVIHTEHGSGYVVSDSALIRTASRLVDHTLGRWVLRRADRVVGVSENVVAFVGELSGREASVFYNAIEPPAAPAAPVARIDRPDIRLVFIGRLVAGKGADEFVDSIALLMAEGHDVHAEILGDGAEREAIEQRIAEHDVGDRVLVRGRVTPDQVREAVRGAILVNPTTLSEGFQTTLLETLAEGGRIVTYSVPGAARLRAEGHQIAITPSQGARALADGIIDMASTPIEEEIPGMDAWYWPERTAEYVRISEEVVAQHRERRRR